ncbi:hypothetical protein DB346_22040 [Verrucomicrobia bacterium LW23]|nr:hypothetical protein DB346_22040 [Verrucomicrobia bacterium LW23]
MAGTVAFVVLSGSGSLIGWAITFCVAWAVLAWQAMRLAVLTPLVPRSVGDAPDVYLALLLAYSVARHMFAPGEYGAMLDLWPVLAGAVAYVSCRYGNLVRKGVDAPAAVAMAALAMGIVLAQSVVWHWFGNEATRSVAGGDAGWIPGFGAGASPWGRVAAFGLLGAVACLAFAVPPAGGKALQGKEMLGLNFAAAAALFVAAALYGAATTAEARPAFGWAALAASLSFAWATARATSILPVGREEALRKWLMLGGLAFGIVVWLATLLMGVPAGSVAPQSSDSALFTLGYWLESPVFGVGPGLMRTDFTAGTGAGGVAASYAQFLAAYGVIGLVLVVAVAWVFVGALATRLEDALTSLQQRGRSGESSEVVTSKEDVAYESIGLILPALCGWALLIGGGYLPGTAAAQPGMLVAVMALSGLALVPKPVQVAEGERVALYWKPVAKWTLRCAALGVALAALGFCVSTVGSTVSAWLLVQARTQFSALKPEQLQALTQSRQRDINEVRATAQWAAWWQPASPLPHRLLGDIDRLLGATLLSQNPSGRPSAADKALAQKHLDAAIAHYSQALRAAPGDDASRLGLAMALSLADRSGVADVVFAQCFARAGRDARPWIAAGWHWARQGRSGEALEAMEHGEFAETGAASAVEARLRLLDLVRAKGVAGPGAASESGDGLPPSERLRDAQDAGQQELVVP